MNNEQTIKILKSNISTLTKETFKIIEHYNKIIDQIEKLEILESIDVKYIGVPNICFSVTECDDSCEEKFSK